MLIGRCFLFVSFRPAAHPVWTGHLWGAQGQGWFLYCTAQTAPWKSFWLNLTLLLLVPGELPWVSCFSYCFWFTLTVHHGLSGSLLTIPEFSRALRSLCGVSWDLGLPSFFIYISLCKFLIRIPNPVFHRNIWCRPVRAGEVGLCRIFFLCQANTSLILRLSEFLWTKRILNRMTS